MMTYFATDGSYGDGEDILILDTVYWDDEMWSVIDSCGDYNRVYVAELFDCGATADEASGILTKLESDDGIKFLYAPTDLANYREANNENN